VPFLSGVENSAIISILQTAGQILICALAGYGLARIPYRWSNVVFYAILLTLMITGPLGIAAGIGFLAGLANRR